MKLSTSSLVRNILVSFIFSGMAVFFGVLFWNELNNAVNHTDGVLIGEIVELTGQAQRRVSKQNQWTDLSIDSSIYNLDSIRTGKSSVASVVLRSYDESGEEVYDEIQLGAETYIIVDLTDNNRTVNFIGGSVFAAGSSGLAISTETTTVYPGEGTVNLNLTEEEGISVNATDGEVKVVVNGEQSIVSPESVLRIDEEEGQVTQEKTPIKPLTPTANALLLTYNDAREVDFSWELLANWETPVLEISADLTFESDVIRRNAGNDSLSMEINHGHWYWRLTDEATGEASIASSFSVSLEQRASLISPVPDSTLTYSGEALTVLLQWERAWFAEFYNVLIANSPVMSNPQKALEVRGNSVLVEELASGQWWWQVVPVYRRGDLDSNLYSETQSFFVEKSRGFSSIELISPGNRSSFSAVEVQDGTSFRWLNQDGIIQYEIKISRDSNFNELTSVAVTQSNWHMFELDPGTYYWRVEGDSADAARVTVSPTWNLEIKPGSSSIELLDPLPGENIEFQPGNLHTFHWRSELKGLSRFTLRRADLRNSARIIQSLTEEPKFTMLLPDEGSYIWQVQLLDSQGSVVLESPEGNFKIVRNLNPPTLLYPAPEESISFPTDRIVLLNWLPAEGVDMYQVVFKSPNGTIVSQDDAVLGLIKEIYIPRNFGGGTYQVELASIRENPVNKETGISEKAIFSFNIEDAIKLEAAIPLTPGNGAVINSQDISSDGLLLQWETSPFLTRWAVELSRNSSVAQYYPTDSPRVLLTELESGQYRWTVHSWDKSNIEAPLSRANSFTVIDHEYLPPPVIRTPGIGENIDMTGAKNLRFEWQSASDDAFTELKLYSGDSQLLLFQIADLKNSFYVLKNLSILDIGDFVLEVTSYTKSSGKEIARRSTVVRVPFSLSVKLPGTAPQIRTRELLYAE